MRRHDEETNQSSTGGATAMAAWTVAWMVTLALATFGPSLLWNPRSTAS